MSGTPQSWSDVMAHSSDATFRAWGSDFSAKLALAGLVKATDTGQINWATVTRPSANSTAAGYEIWKFGDTLQATAPIFIKLEYGSGIAASNLPQMWITVGTGSDGAGTITGQSSGRQTTGLSGGTAGSTVINYPSYFCHAPGFLGCAFRQGWVVPNTMGFSIVRYSDDDGTPNGEGFTLHWVAFHSTAASNVHQSIQSVRTAATAVTFTAVASGGTYGVWPHSITSSSTTNAGDLQVVPYWTATKKFQQEFALCGYLDSEVSQGSTFSVALKGATARTFIALGPSFGLGGIGPTDGRTAMLWEALP
jgi:hypothetical protein